MMHFILVALGYMLNSIRSADAHVSFSVFTESAPSVAISATYTQSTFEGFLYDSCHLSYLASQMLFLYLHILSIWLLKGLEVMQFHYK